MGATLRTIIFYKDYFLTFYNAQKPAVKLKINWTVGIIRDLDIVPDKYFKHMEGSEGLFELKVKVGSDIFRIFCFFDEGNLTMLANGFQKKTAKTPRQELDRATQIQREYYNEKHNNL